MAESNGNGNGNRLRAAAESVFMTWVSRLAIIGLGTIATWNLNQVVGQLETLTSAVQSIDKRLVRVETWVELQGPQR